MSRTTITKSTMLMCSINMSAGDCVDSVTPGYWQRLTVSKRLHRPSCRVVVGLQRGKHHREDRVYISMRNKPGATSHSTEGCGNRGKWSHNRDLWSKSKVLNH